MARIFAVVGFTYLACLTFLFVIPERFLLCMPIIFLVLVMFFHFIKNIKIKKLLTVCCVTCLFASIVYSLNYNFNIKPLEKFNEQDITVSGKLTDLPYKKYDRYYYLLKIDEVDGNKTRKFNIKLSSSEPLEIDACDKFTGKIYAYLPKNNPEFNVKAYYRSKNIHVLGYAYNYLDYKIKEYDKFDFNYYILKLRYKLLSVPRYLFNNDISGIINAVFLGEKNNIPEKIKQNFQNIGVYHLVAVSGIHVSIIAQSLVFVLKKLKISMKFSNTIAIIVIILFISLAGFSVSVMRAGIVMIIYLFGKIIFKSPDSLNSLGLAVFLITLFNPNSALDIGLWMSTSASLGIILFEHKINNYIKNRMFFNSNLIINYVISTISTSLSVTFLTLPIEILFFKQISVIFIISNLLIIPLITIILNFVLILDLFYLILPVSILSPIIIICGVTTNLVIYLSNMLSKIPFLIISFDYNLIKLLAIFLIILILSVFYFN